MKELEIIKGALTDGLQLNPIIVNIEYMQEWNESMQDFTCLTFNGELLRNTLYRKGGIGGKMKDGYILLLKYVEDLYEDSITKDPGRKKHLAGHWCIVDKYGNEKVVFKRFASPYLHGGQIYSLDQKYYNIETGESYGGSTRSALSSADYIFIENAYDNDESKRGVIKVNKYNGTWELFPAEKR